MKPFWLYGKVKSISCIHSGSRCSWELVWLLWIPGNHFPAYRGEPVHHCAWDLGSEELYAQPGPGAQQDEEPHVGPP